MIRVNLLEGVGGDEGRLESLVRTSGGSAFIARREGLLGFLCLGLAGAALFYQLRNPGEDAPATPPDGPTAIAEASPIIEIDKPEAAPNEAAETIASEQGAPGESTTEDLAAEAQQEASEETPPVEDLPANDQPDKLNPAEEEVGVQAPSEVEAADAGGADAPTTAKPAALTQLVVSSRGDTLRIFAATGTQPKYRTFRLDSPNRIVVDLPGVRLALPRAQHKQTPDHPQVQHVRAGQYQAKPPQSRIVLDVTSFPEVEILPQFNGLYLVVKKP